MLPSSFQTDRGFSLIEVLVALVILSVGMLGVLTLQVKGLQFSQSAMTNTQAVSIASDMADRIRANPTAGEGYAAILGGAGAMPTPICADIDGQEVTAVCGAGPMAAFDIWHWKDQLQNSRALPTGDGAITVLPTATGFNYTVDIQWMERGEVQNYQIVFDN